MALRLLTTCLLLSSFLSAQVEDPSQLTNLDYGNVNRSQLDRLYAVGDELYATFRYAHTAADGGTPLMRINPATGVASPVLESSALAAFSTPNIGSAPAVHAAGQATFALHQNDATGGALYRIDGGQPELLHTAPSTRYSRVVEHQGTYYFLTANPQEGGYPGQPNPYGQLLLFRTDGSQSGTELVTELSGYQSGMSVLEIHPLGNYLLLTTGGEDYLTLTSYDLATSTPTQISFDRRNLYLQNPFRHLIDPSEPLFTEHDGRLYTFAATTRQSDPAVFAVDPTAATATRLPLPAPDLTNTRGQLVKHPTGLHLYLTSGRQSNEWHAFSVDDTSPSFAGTIQDLERLHNSSGKLIAPPLKLADRTVYFIEQVETVHVISIEADGSERELMTFGKTNYMGKYYHTGNMVYLPIDTNMGFLALDLSDGTVKRARTNWIQDHFDTHVAAVDGFLYFRYRGQPGDLKGGLYRWDGKSDAPLRIGDYVSARDVRRPFVYGYDATAGNVLLRRDKTDLVYESSTDRLSTLPMMEPVKDLLGTSRMLNDRVILNGRSANNVYQNYVLDGTQLIMPRYFDELGTEVPGRDVNLQFRLSTGGIVQLAREAEQTLGTRFALATTNAQGSFVITPLDATVFGLDAPAYPRPMAGDGFYAAVRQGNSMDVNFMLYDEDLNRVKEYDGRGAAALIGASADYVFLEQSKRRDQVQAIDVLDRESGALVVSLPFPDNGEAPYERMAYLVGNNLVFTHTTAATGREWFVASPENTAVQVLNDIYPGPGQGVTARTAVHFNDKLYFVANDGQTGSELYVTDGTPAGTTRVTDLATGQASSHPTDFYATQDRLFFSANGPTGRELYEISGEDAGAKLVVDLLPGTNGSAPYDLVSDGRRLYFMASSHVESTPELFVLPLDLINSITPSSVAAYSAKVFPNPAGTDPVTITAPDNQLMDRIEVYATDGRQLSTQSVNSVGTTQLNVADLPSGQYWLRVIYQDGNVSLNALQRR